MTVGAVAAVAAQAAAQRQAILTADAAWAPFATQRRMHHRCGRFGWGHVQWSRVDAEVDAVAVAIELVPRSQGVHTAVVAAVPAPLQGDVEATREGLLAKIGKLFGAQDILLGDEVFDRAFLVKGTSEPTVRAVLTRTVRAEMLALGADRLVYDDGSAHQHAAMLVLEMPGVVQEAERLDRALRLVAELARVRAPESAYR